MNDSSSNRNAHQASAVPRLAAGASEPTGFFDSTFKAAGAGDGPTPTPAAATPAASDLDCPTLEVHDSQASARSASSASNPPAGGSNASLQFSWDPNREQPAAASHLQGAPQVAGYDILSELGRGGMGVVYRARHRGLKREVALKMLLGGIHASPEQLARFRAEAEAVAKLQHPHIIQIYDVGQQDGLPYFSLEYIDGGSLDRQLSGSTQSAEDAARMTRLLALAMSYAHERGIVHRDLKPANVLLTRDGEPRITDFGLVKRLEDERGGTTRTGAIMGTPGYMAPEQARSDKEVGPLADVYALGATLYAMLTGRPPFLAATPFDTIVQLLHDEPVPPSQLHPKLSVDLETICLKCLQKDPARRYANCQALAEDLRRFLDGEPIQARPVSRLERAWRWCRKRPLVSALSGIAAALALVVLVGAPIAAVRISFERDAALRARDLARFAERSAVDAQRRAEEALDLAETNERQAMAARADADAHALSAAKQRGLALEALGTLVTKVQNQLRETPATQKLKQELLATGLEGLRKVAESAQSSSESDALMAEAHLRMGDIFQSLAQHADARQQYELSHAIRETLAQASPADLDCRANLATTFAKLGDISLLEGDREQARNRYSKSLQIREQVAQERGTDLTSQVNLATAYVKMGNVSEPSQARQLFSSALDIRRMLAEWVTDATRPNRERDVWITLNKLAELSLKLEDSAAARQYYDEALARAMTIQTLVPDSNRAKLDLAQAHIALGKLDTAASQVNDALVSFRHALDLLRPMADEDPKNLELQTHYALTLARSGDHATALRLAEQVRGLAPQNYLNLFNVACCYAIAAATLERRGTVEPLSAQDSASKEAWISQAIATLRQAGQRGLKGADSVIADADLDTIRGHADYPRLLDELGRPN